MSDLPAGRELDAEIAVRVMGWRGRYLCDSAPMSTFKPRVVAGPAELLDYWITDGRSRECGWSPSTDIAAAWEVVERLRSAEFGLGWKRRDFSIRQYDRLEGGLWVCETDGDPDEIYANGRQVYVTADTAPLAICRAALKTVPTRMNSEGNLVTGKPE